VVSGRNRAIGRLSGGAAIGALLSAFAGVTFVATGSAWAACTLSAGTTTCSGSTTGQTALTTGISPAGNPLSVILDGTFINPAAVPGGTGSVYLTASGAGGLTLNQYVSSAVWGASLGIYAHNAGTGATNVTLAGSVTSSGGSGIQADNTAAGGAITLNQTAGSISGTATGIYALNNGTAAMTINTAGSVTATGGTAVYAKNVGAVTTDLTVTQAAGGVISSATADGIYAMNNGTGSTTVTTAGSVTAGGSGYGIQAETQVGKNVTVTQTAGSISGVGLGIEAYNGGTGATTITAAGSVTGTNGYGVAALSDGTGTTTVTVNQTAGSITGLNGDGIYAENYGTGATAITTAGTVSGTGSAAANTGYGIYALNYGSGALSVTQTAGSITGTGNDGIFAYKDTGTAGALTVTQTAGSITGTGGDGIDAWNYGTGITTITAAGSVTGTGDVGIYAKTLLASGPVSVQVDPTGLVQGAAGGVWLDAASASTITNAGTIQNLSGLAADLAITSTSGPTTLTNTGVLTGVVNLAAYANTVNLLAGGAVTGTINTGNGSSVLNFSGGTLTGAVNMGTGGGNVANLTGLTAANLSGTTHIDGGTGAGNVLNLSNVQYKGGSFAADNTALGVNLMTGWNAVNLTNGASWTQTGNLTLSGLTSVTSPSTAVNIDATSTLYAGNGVNPTISATAGTLTLTNAGTIDLTNGGSTAQNTLTIAGNYVGVNGVLKIATALGNDSSATDKLMISGAATGSTNIYVTNTGGLGAQTTTGIMVVQASSASSLGAFSLGARVAAGAYNYALYGVQNGAVDDWYLRSTSTPTPTPSSGGNPTYRDEVYVDLSVTALAARVGLATLGTLDDRMAQPLSQGTGASASAKGSWGRAIGEWGSLTGASSSSYSFGGLQVGQHLFGSVSESGAVDLAGLYFGYSRASGNVNNVGNLHAGDTGFNAYSVGAYWTHYTPQGWYTDTVAQGTRYADISAASTAGQNFGTQGFGFLGSLESGFKLALKEGFSLTPEAQIIYQHLSFTGGQDAYGLISYSDTNSAYGRLGVKASREWTADLGGRELPLSVWVRGNVWSAFGANAHATFAALDGSNPTTVATALGKTWANATAGLTAQIDEFVSAYAVYDYDVGISSGPTAHSHSGKIGAIVRW
jgi:outer membrane autotransporter protein